MRSDLDPRLISFLQGAIGFTDSLRDLGVTGEIRVRLSREAGVELLQLVSGASDARAEEWSQRDRPFRLGLNSLKVAGVTYEWPRAGWLGEAVFAALDQLPAMGAAANDNDEAQLVEFEGESPALR